MQYLHIRHWWEQHFCIEPILDRYLIVIFTIKRCFECHKFFSYSCIRFTRAFNPTFRNRGTVWWIWWARSITLWSCKLFVYNKFGLLTIMFWHKIFEAILLMSYFHMQFGLPDMIINFFSVLSGQFKTNVFHQCGL